MTSAGSDPLLKKVPIKHYDLEQLKDHLSHNPVKDHLSHVHPIHKRVTSYRERENGNFVRVVIQLKCIYAICQTHHVITQLVH